MSCEWRLTSRRGRIAGLREPTDWLRVKDDLMPGDQSPDESVRQRHVHIEGGAVVLSGFHETDPVVVEIIREGDDPETTVHQLLGIGARSARMSRTTMDVQFVENACRELFRDFDTAVAARFDGEESAVPRVLNGFRDKLKELLDDAFDADSKRSIIGKFDTLVREIRSEDRLRMRQLLDAADERSPLHRLRRELIEAAHQEAKDVREMIAHIQEAVAVRAAESAVLDKASIKGRHFEDTLHDAVCALVAAYGDIPEQTGDRTGITGGKKGDELVTLNEEDTRGVEAAYVLEAKTGRLDMRKTFDELAAAMVNRNATAAIAVFGRAANAPTSVPFFSNGDKAIVVLDQDEPDITALRLATMWARWIVRRKLAEDERELNVDEVAGLIDEAARALKRHATIRGCHSTARRKIEEASRHVDDLVADVEDVIERLRRAIDDDKTT